jgi:hypothetical protein
MFCVLSQVSEVLVSVPAQLAQRPRLLSTFAQTRVLRDGSIGGGDVGAVGIAETYMEYGFAG